MADDGSTGLSPRTCRRMLRALDGRAWVAETDGRAWVAETDGRAWMAENDGELDLREVRVADTGFNDVYFLTVGTPAGTRECVLKVSDDTADQVRAEARLCSLLDDATAVPVPTVFGRVDAHPDLPAPYFLMERLSGESPEGPPGELSLASVEALARATGRHLGDAHTVDAFDAFGWIRAAGDVDGDEAGGARPLARRHGLTVAGATDSWPSYLRDLAEMHLRHHPETRFDDRTPEIRRAIDEWIDRLPGDARPVVGRVDHAFENTLVDADGEITALLDWGMLRTVAPAYDLACAELSFTGTVGLSTERRERVRAALREGYETRASVDGDETRASVDRDGTRASVAEVASRRRLYLLVNLVARQNWLSEWIPEEGADEIERDHRALLDELLAA